MCVHHGIWIMDNGSVFIFNIIFIYSRSRVCTMYMRKSTQKTTPKRQIMNCYELAALNSTWNYDKCKWQSMSSEHTIHQWRYIFLYYIQCTHVHSAVQPIPYHFILYCSMPACVRTCVRLCIKIEFDKNVVQLSKITAIWKPHRTSHWSYINMNIEHGIYGKPFTTHRPRGLTRKLYSQNLH